VKPNKLLGIRMALSSTSFVNGQIGNPNGRPLGSRNKRTKEIIQQIVESNNKDPLITLSEISSSDPDSAIRATAANMLAPYMHSKMQSTPAPRFVEESFGIPTFTHLSDAEQFLARIAAFDPPTLKWSDLRYVFDIQEDCNDKEAIQA